MKALKSLTFCLIIALCFNSISIAPVLALSAPLIHYVKPATVGAPDCSDWANACGLQAALGKANPGDQIWVATGTYIPSLPAGRLATFQLKSGVAIYGGFPAQGGTWEMRDPVIFVTSLSGDIGTAGDSADNSIHVVTSNSVNATAISDGFTIKGRNANANTPYNKGGGMYNSGSPTLTNVTFNSNTATQDGGGMYNTGENPTLTNVTFSSNSAGNNGGGMYNSGSFTLTNVTFSGNSAGNIGGGLGMVDSTGNPTLTNVTFSSNTADSGGGVGSWNSTGNHTLNNVTFSGNAADSGGGMYYYKGNPTLTNSILWGNTPDQVHNISGSFTITFSDVEGDYSGDGNINVNPLLGVLYNNGGYTQTHALGEGSKAIDAGSPAYCPATDQRTYARPVDGDAVPGAICDMGAYEYLSHPAAFSLTVNLAGEGSVTVIPKKTVYDWGEVVTLTPSAATGWTFTGWSGNAIGSANPLKISMTAITSITATFTQDEYSLTVTPVCSGTVAKTPDQPTYHYRDVVTLTPTADPGWTFKGWTGTTVTDNKVTINGNTNITATFTKDESKLYLPLILR